MNIFTLKIIQLRIIEVLQSITTGAILALSGAVLQKILKNPLADPFILGISSGGSCFSGIFVLLNLSSYTFLGNIDRILPIQSIFSIIGCLISLLLILYFKHKIKSTNEEYSYLIIGIILNSFFSAILMITISVADQSQLNQIHTWLIGSLQPISMIQIIILITICFPFLLFVLKKSYLIQYLIFNDEFCRSLGINPSKERSKLIFYICILISIVVSISGSIGFIGLIVPHYVAKLHKSTAFNEFILTMICGAILLVNADLLSKICLSPSQLPIGIFTALMGAPALSFILLRNKTSE